MTNLSKSIFTTFAAVFGLLSGCSGSIDPSPGESSSESPRAVEIEADRAENSNQPKRDCNVSVTPEVPLTVNDRIKISTTAGCLQQHGSKGLHFGTCPGCAGNQCCRTVDPIRCEDGHCQTSFKPASPGRYELGAEYLNKPISLDVKPKDSKDPDNVRNGLFEEAPFGILASNNPPTAEIHIPEMEYNDCTTDQYTITCEGQDVDGDSLDYSMSGKGCTHAASADNECIWTPSESHENYQEPHDPNTKEFTWTCTVDDGTTTRTVEDKAYVADGNDDPSELGDDKIIWDYPSSVSFGRCSDSSYTVEAKGYDADGDEFTYNWLQYKGDCTDNICEYQPKPEDEGDTITYEVEIADEGNCTATESVDVDIDSAGSKGLAVVKADDESGRPDPVDPLEIEVDNTVYLDGTNSAKSCGSYSWSWVHCPEGPPMSNCPTIKNDGSNLKKKFEADFDGADPDDFVFEDYEVELEVTNNQTGNTASDTVVIKPKNCTKMLYPSPSTGC